MSILRLNKIDWHAGVHKKDEWILKIGYKLCFSGVSVGWLKCFKTNDTDNKKYEIMNIVFCEFLNYVYFLCLNN